MRRFRRSFSRGRPPREPLSWDRVNLRQSTAQNTMDTVQLITLWDPTAVVAGHQDLRLTLRRLKLNIMLQTTLSGAVASTIYAMYCGIYLGGVGETARNPRLSATADLNTDWLWLATHARVAAAADDKSIANLFANERTTEFLVDVKAQRKVDLDQAIYFAMLTEQLSIDGTDTLATATSSWAGNASILYSRTMRR